MHLDNTHKKDIMKTILIGRIRENQTEDLLGMFTKES